MPRFRNLRQPKASRGTPRAPATTFRSFPKLPQELRDCIWELALPGPRLIEVYPLPRLGRSFLEDVFGIESFKWRATKCACKRQCQNSKSLLGISQVCRESRQIFAERCGKYAKCFDTLINWEMDTIYVGPRVGHLHNMEFLKTLDLADGLHKLRHLAIDDNVWDENNCMHGPNRQQLKRCSPAGMIQQMDGLETLTIVGRSGLWRDGNELLDSINYFYEEWETDSEDENEDGGDDDDDVLSGDELTVFDPMHEPGDDSGNRTKEAAGLGHPTGPLPSVIFLKPASRDDDDNDQSSMAWEDIEDFWYCPYEEQTDRRPYNSRVTDELIRRFSPTADCGLALIDFEEIERIHHDAGWSIDHDSSGVILRCYTEDFDELKNGVEQVVEQHNNPEWKGYADYASYKPPILKLALFRRTAPSCYAADWSGLEKDYISIDNVEEARANPRKYAKSKEVLEHYPRGFKLRYDSRIASLARRANFYEARDAVNGPPVIKTVTIGLR